MRGACPECGVEVDDDVGVCPRCGTLQDVERCPSCQGVLPPEAKRCPSCNSPLFVKEEDVGGSATRLEVSRKLVTVFSGSRETALAMQVALADAGVHLHLADYNTRILDNTVPGGNVFGFELQARFEEAETARQAVEELRSRTAGSAGVTPPVSDEERRRRALEDLGRRICWSTGLVFLFLVFLAPYAVWLGFRYVPGAMRLQPRPKGHAYTLVALLLSAAATLCLAMAVATLFLSLIGLPRTA